jgi:hypothetical protein
MENNSICFAYYMDGKWGGWYGGTFGSVSSVPKVYCNTEKQIEIVVGNFTYKMKSIEESSFEKEKGKVEGLATLSLLRFDTEELLRGKEVELRIVTCPVYDGPNPDFDKDKYKKEVDDRFQLLVAEGIDDIPGGSERTARVKEFTTRHPRPVSDSWIYADYNEIIAWSKVEPTEFVKVIKYKKK